MAEESRATSANQLEERLQSCLEVMKEARSNKDWELLINHESEARSLIEEVLSQPGKASGELAELLDKFHSLYRETMKACEEELESIRSQIEESTKRQEAIESWQQGAQSE